MESYLRQLLAGSLRDEVERRFAAVEAPPNGTGISTGSAL
jgi:hypothetical protein